MTDSKHQFASNIKSTESYYRNFMTSVDFISSVIAVIAAAAAAARVNNSSYFIFSELAIRILW